jgi:hypothetical protein
MLEPKCGEVEVSDDEKDGKGRPSWLRSGVE